MKLSRFLWLLLPLLFTACGLSDQQKADYAAVQRSGVSPATYDKMLHGDPLALVDIENLSRARVNDGVILRYLRDQGTIYTLNSGDVLRLRKAGVSQSIIDYMLQTARYYGSGPGFSPYPYGPYYDPFWYGPYGPPFGFYGGFGYGHHWHGGYHGGGGYHHH
jgi:hypothetical protein